jgi:hypothetical protein
MTKPAIQRDQRTGIRRLGQTLPARVNTVWTISAAVAISVLTFALHEMTATGTITGVWIVMARRSRSHHSS